MKGTLPRMSVEDESLVSHMAKKVLGVVSHAVSYRPNFTAVALYFV